MANVILSKLATDNINEILANVYEFTGFISTPEKLLAEFEKTFRLISPRCGMKCGGFLSVFFEAIRRCGVDFVN